MSAAWSSAEDAVLRDVISGRISNTLMLARLPGRTRRAIEGRIFRLKAEVRQ